MRIIESDADVAEGAAHLAALCPRMAHALEVIGAPPLRRRPDGFAALLQAIVGQQVSTAAAAGIWARMEAAGLITEDAVAAADTEALRAAGLSRAKARYAAALAEARLDYAALRAAPEAEVIATLTAVPGVGRWTAEIYLMFAVGRADVFAPGDLALREAARALYGLEARPTIPALDEMAMAWRPWRAVAARILFAYYRHLKGREGVS
ncbi:DNA-3-methyladenine glycosylase 2 family protein [Pikeienuella piscinae]|uniref:DNA-3-methyladenine glycosylase II n=1 Tax=Pikeienuella piscinae TaxID=2748098 RepID=A0A7L5BT08_9RHOB|nr:DNA-3-methyladenine glycosylase 2 family protein [Pikeienuella piscinae]QIE53981.1 DNA-3-methyladenine glycosylase 2 family protein [Pikeienuella piscinae]